MLPGRTAGGGTQEAGGEAEEPLRRIHGRGERSRKAPGRQRAGATRPPGTSTLGFETLSGAPAPATLMTADEGNAGAGDVDDEEVRHVASLARVDLDEEEVERFAAQFADILEYFEALEEVPDVDADAELANVMRPDEVREGLTQAEALRNAPETEDGQFRGPRVS